MLNNAFELEVLRLTNEFRQANGRSPLVIDQNLDEAADLHSQSMAVDDFFSHTGEDGTQPGDRAKTAGYETGYVGENIAIGYSTPKAVVDGWINSPGHRANMLKANYNEIGIGYYYLENDTGSLNYNHYWTQVFGKGTITAAPPVTSPPVTSPPVTLPPVTSPPVTSPPVAPLPEIPTSDNRPVLRGTTGADELVGGSTDQKFYGKRGDDVIEAGAGNDKLVGGRGRDRLLGEAGNDYLRGGRGDDWLQGSAQNSTDERDILNGGGGGDRFVLGDSSGTFYDDGQSATMGLGDYALITRFNQRQGDVIQLSAKHNYRLGAAPQGVERGQAIFIDSPAGQQDELIAIIQRGRSVQLDSSAFEFV